MTTTKKKLIEVALPLEKINVASAREKSIRHGHPSTLHLWWARRPLAAARAVIFAQMVDDPSGYVDELLRDRVKRMQAERVLTERKAAWKLRREAFGAAEGRGEQGLVDPGEEPTLEECVADVERQRLFRLIEQLVQWENTTNEDVLKQARDEIWKSWRRTCAENQNHPRAAELFNPDKLPAFHDPFAGGGAIPLEAQRLGLESYASDLNPVAVLINKAMIEIPPKFAGQPPVNPEARKGQMVLKQQWKGAQGLAEDVRYYGQWMRDEAEKRIGHLYPKVEVTAAMAQERPDLKPYVGKKLTVIAWLWARTVKSPNPAFRHVDVPLVSSFLLATKSGKEAYVEPVIEGDSYRFLVRADKPKDPVAVKIGTTAGKRAAFRCLMSNVPITYDHIRIEGQAGRMGARLMAIVAEGERERVYLTPTLEHVSIARQAQPEWESDTALPDNPRDFKTPNYGMKTFGDLFTPRQLVALNTFSDLVQEVREYVRRDALATGMPDLQHYGDAVSIMLAFTVSRLADRCSNVCSWDVREGQGRESGVRNVFSRQAIAMSWDYAEANPLTEVAASMKSAIGRVADVLERLPMQGIGWAFTANAADQNNSSARIFSTDPPYYDNIGYADLSDFF